MTAQRREAAAGICQRAVSGCTPAFSPTRSDHTLMTPATLLTKTLLIPVTLLSLTFRGPAAMIALFRVAVSIPRCGRSSYRYVDSIDVSRANRAR